MKIIFSRKGIDSQYRPAGIKDASAILPNGMPLSFPIPVSWSQEKGDKEKGIPYSEVLAGFEGESLYGVMRELNPKSESSKTKDKPPFHKKAECHYDPDLPLEHEPYIGAFGQSAGASTHLDNYGVEEGDVFLFFGSFKHTLMDGDRLIFDKDHPRHVIFGYLQVGSIWKGGDPPKNIRETHPHLLNQSSYSNNRIYVARETLSFLEGRKGWGILPFHEKRALTKMGYQKSLWELPRFFGKSSISISNHGDRGRFSLDHITQRTRLQTVGIGQEFVVSVDTSDWETQRQLEAYLKDVLC